MLLRFPRDAGVRVAPAFYGVILLLLLSVGALYMLPVRWFKSFWVPPSFVFGDRVITSRLIYLPAIAAPCTG
jgi:hypothetical protein